MSEEYDPKKIQSWDVELKFFSEMNPHFGMHSFWYPVAVKSFAKAILVINDKLDRLLEGGNGE